MNEESKFDKDGYVLSKPEVDDPWVVRIWWSYKDKIHFEHDRAFKLLVKEDVVTFDDDYWELMSHVEPPNKKKILIRLDDEYEYTYLPEVMLGGFIYGSYPVSSRINGKEDLELLTRLYIEDRKWGATKWMARRLGCKPWDDTQEKMKADEAWEDWMDDLRGPMDWARFHKDKDHECVTCTPAYEHNE